MSELPTSVKSQGFDVQDGLITAGFVTLVAGVACIYWPAALILAGLLFFAFAWLIEKAQAADLRKEKRGPA